jgi:hypothetical protein
MHGSRLYSYTLTQVLPMLRLYIRGISQDAVKLLFQLIIIETEELSHFFSDCRFFWKHFD